jgi:hypothetical protein
MILLTVSSGLFMISSIVNFKRRKYRNVGVCATTSIVSANFWRKEDYNSIRYKLDKVVACNTFVYFTITGIKTITIYKCGLISGIGALYLTSNVVYPRRSWKYFHALFHCMGAIGMITK